MTDNWAPPNPPDALPRVLAHVGGEYRWILIDRLPLPRTEPKTRLGGGTDG